MTDRDDLVIGDANKRYREGLHDLTPGPELVPAKAMTGEQKRAWAEEQLADDNPEALFMDGLDAAIVGVGRQYTKPALVVYRYDGIIAALMEQGMDETEAMEYADFNVTSAWAGENTPIIVDVPSPDD